MHVDSIDGNIITGKHCREGVPEVGVQVLQFLNIEVLFIKKSVKNSKFFALNLKSNFLSKSKPIRCKIVENLVNCTQFQTEELNPN